MACACAGGGRPLEAAGPGAVASPNLTIAPPPWTGTVVALPYEVEPGPPVAPECRRCGRSRVALRHELEEARQVFASVLELLDAARAGEQAARCDRDALERELVELKALLLEYRDLADMSDDVLAGSAVAVREARQQLTEVRRAVASGKRRASALNRKLRELEGGATRAGGLERPAPAAAPGPVVRVAAAAPSAPAARRIAELEAALREERIRARRYALYGKALEERLRQLAEEPAAVDASAAVPRETVS